MVIVDKDGEVMTTNGRGAMATDPKGEQVRGTFSAVPVHKSLVTFFFLAVPLERVRGGSWRRWFLFLEGPAHALGVLFDQAVHVERPADIKNGFMRLWRPCSWCSVDILSESCRMRHELQPPNV